VLSSVRIFSNVDVEATHPAVCQMMLWTKSTPTRPKNHHKPKWREGVALPRFVVLPSPQSGHDFFLSLLGGWKNPPSNNESHCERTDDHQRYHRWNPAYTLSELLEHGPKKENDPTKCTDHYLTKDEYPKTPKANLKCELHGFLHNVLA